MHILGGFDPDPTGEHSAVPDPLVGFKGPTSTAATSDGRVRPPQNRRENNFITTIEFKLCLAIKIYRVLPILHRVRNWWRI